MARPWLRRLWLALAAACAPATALAGHNEPVACSALPALTGNVTTTTGSCSTTIASSAVTNAMLAGSIAATKLIGTDITTVGTLTAGSINWSGNIATSGTLAGSSLSGVSGTNFTLQSLGAADLMLNAPGGQTGRLGNAGTTYFRWNNGIFYPDTDQGGYLGTGSFRFIAAYATTFYGGAGVAGVSCTAGTVNVVTMVVTGGIITHC